MEEISEDKDQPTQSPPDKQASKKEGLKFKLGPLEVEGPIGMVGAVLGGLIVGAVVILYLVLVAKQPSSLISAVVGDAVKGTLTAQPTWTPLPTLTPQPVTTVEVIKTVTVIVEKPVEVVKTVEVVRTVEVTVEVPRTVIVEVTPTPLTPPDVLKARLETAFQSASEYLISGDPTRLSDQWLGRLSITEEIKYLRQVFSEITSAQWKVGDVYTLKKEEGVEVYTLEVNSNLIITGVYICSGELIRDTVELPYPSLVRAEIQSLGRVRIYSWTKSSDSIPGLCPTRSP